MSCLCVSEGVSGGWSGLASMGLRHGLSCQSEQQPSGCGKGAWQWGRGGGVDSSGSEDTLDILQRTGTI